MPKKFLYLLTSLLLISCGGGGSNSPVIVSSETIINIPDFTLSAAISNGTLYSQSQHLYNKYVIDTDIVSDKYFSQNPNGHIAVVGRCNSPVINKSVEGVGFLLGYISYSYGYAAPEIETYMGLSNNLLKPLNNVQPPLLVDGNYHITFISNISSDIRTDQLIVYQNNIKIYDTGPVPDANMQYDTSFVDICTGHVYDGDTGAGTYKIPPTWSFTFKNTKLTLS